MVNFLKNKVSSEKVGILLLAVLTILSGFIFYTQKDFKVEATTKTNSVNKDQNLYYFDDEYYGYNTSYDYYDDYYYNKDYYYNDDDSDYMYSSDYIYNTDNYYNNGYGEYYYYDYSDTTKPSMKGNSSTTLYQYQEFDPRDDVTAYHSKMGDMTDAIEITYNDVDTNIPGTYSVVYKVCNYPGSVYCTTFTKSVIVKSKNYQVGDSHLRGPIWNNTKDVSCSNGSTQCDTYNVKAPTATDPVSHEKLEVTLIDGYVDIYQKGTYVLVYYAETENGISGTQTKKVTITNDSYNSSNNLKQTKKYVQNQTSEYYDDGYYRGVLTPNYQSPVLKYIEDYKWENVVGYKYRCDVVGESGLNGWSYVAADISNGNVVENADNHPTYNYNNGVFSGTLKKTNFYCKENCGSEVNSKLGVCQNQGEIKYVYTTWVGVYSGYVSSNTPENQTYSGYVYLYR